MGSIWIALAAALSLGGPEGRAETDVDRALAELAEGRLESAAALIERAVSDLLSRPVLEAESARHLLLAGRIQLQLGDPEKALTRFQAVAERASGEAALEAKLGLAEASREMGDFARLRALLHSLGNTPLAGGAEYLSLQVELLLEERRVREAGALLGALARRPEFRTEALFHLGVLAYERGDHAACARFMEEVTAAESSRIPARIYLARSRLELGRLAEARSALAPLRRRGLAEVAYLSGRIAEEEGRLDEAEKELKRAVEIDPRYLEALYLLARVVARRGERERAQALFARYRAIAAREEERRRRLLRLAEAAKAGSLEPTQALERIELELEGGRPEEARRAAWDLLRVEPSHSRARVLLVLALARLGRTAHAVTQCRKVLAEDPENEAARRLLEELVGSRSNAAESGAR